MNSDSVRLLENQALFATVLPRWSGEGETKKIAVNNVGFVTHFGEMLFTVGLGSVEQSVDGHDALDAADAGERPVDQSVPKRRECFA